jgi:hypothetical protein
MTILGLALLLAVVAIWAVIIAHAFKVSVGQGLACLCVPFYAWYFAIARFEHPRRRLVVATWVIATIIGVGLVQCGTARSLLEQIRDAGGKTALP